MRPPTARQLEALRLLWELENKKEVADRMGIRRHGLEYLLAALRDRVGIKWSGHFSTISLLKWGVRAGILTTFLLTAQARPHRRPPPSVPPPVTSYTTNYSGVTLAWNTLTNSLVSELQYSGDGGISYTGSILTFSTSASVSQLRTNAVYSFRVHDSYGTNSPFSDFSNVVQFGTTSNVVVSGSTTLQ